MQYRWLAGMMGGGFGAWLVAFSGCGGDASDPGGSGGTGQGGGVAASGGAGGVGAAGGAAGGEGGTGASGPGPVTCATPPPSGAATPPPIPAYSGGSCPVLAPGVNTLASSGVDRELILVLPEGHDATVPAPLFFLWHWLGGDAQDFLDQGAVQQAADELGFIAVIPEAKGDLQFTWPMYAGVSQARIDEDLVFFDDMLACVAEQLAVNESCIASTGVSAGALFTAATLAGQRGDRLSSIVSLSGGTGGVIQAWGAPEHAMPALVLWGGATDTCAGLLSFETLSKDLEAGLEAGGHFTLECIHNCGHSVPPFDPPAGEPAFLPMWRFMLDHPYWLEPGQSPYTSEGLPAGTPEWCAIGAGNAEPRVGECPFPSQC